MSHTCEKWQEELSAYIDGELAEGEKDAMEQHVSSCPDCQACLKAYQTVQSVLVGWQTQPPAVLRPGIMYKTQRSKKTDSVLWRRWISLGSVAAALLLVTWLVNGNPLKPADAPAPQSAGGVDVAGATDDAGAADTVESAKMFGAELASAEPTGFLADAPELEEGTGDAVLSKLAPQARNEEQSDVTLYYIYLSVDLSQAELAALPNAEPQADGSVLIPVEGMETLLQKWEKESVSNSGKTQIHNAASDKVCLISSQDG